MNRNFYYNGLIFLYLHIHDCKFKTRDSTQGHKVVPRGHKAVPAMKHKFDFLLLSMHTNIFRTIGVKTLGDCIGRRKVLMRGKLLQRFTHFLYCSVLSLGGKVNTRRMSHPDMESIFTKIIYEIFWS